MCVEALQLHVLLVLAREVNHRADTEEHVGAVVVEALGGELQFQRQGDVGVLHVLRGLRRVASVVKHVEVAEDEALRAEVHGWCEAEGEMIAQAHVGEHAHAEARVPCVGIAEHRARSAILHQLWTHVLELNVLQVKAYADAEVQGTQVYVGLVLRLANLAQGHGRQQEQQGKGYECRFLHSYYLTEKRGAYYMPFYFDVV